MELGLGAVAIVVIAAAVLWLLAVAVVVRGPYPQWEGMTLSEPCKCLRSV